MVCAIKLIGALTGIVVMSLCLIFFYDIMTQCDYFNARKIIVHGTQRLSKAQILKTAGVRTDINILAIHLEAVRQRLKTLAWVQEAAVRRELPDTLYITVQEYQPLAVLEAGTRYLMDTEGHVFKRQQASDPQNLPLITGLPLTDLSEPGQKRQPAFAAVMELLSLGGKAGSVMPCRMIEQVAVDPEIGLTLHVRQGAKVIRLGFNGYAGKLALLDSFTRYLATRNEKIPRVALIDLNSEERIVIRPMKSDAGEPLSKKGAKEV